MAGKIAGTVFTLFIMTFLVAVIIFYFLHTGIKEEVNDVNYSVAETVATSGEFTTDLYDFLEKSLGRYGDYRIKLKLEEQISPGEYDINFENSYVLNRKLKVGDRVTIFLEDKDPSLFGRLINAAIAGYRPDRMIDTNIKSLKTAIISNNAVGTE
ncbi:MAG: hypothetical protein N3I35_11605 [Clostridia bacterium]|nr:hypothetical protein [Clostridia bacterium]